MTLTEEYYKLREKNTNKFIGPKKSIEAAGAMKKYSKLIKKLGST